jgi:N6-adenosine-specific RNA methylase IME4
MENANSLAILDGATKMLAEVRTIDDAKQIMDVAASAKYYAQKHGLGKQAVSYAMEIEIQAEIKLGEFLRKQKETEGLNTGGWVERNAKSCSTQGEPQDRTPTLAEVGISKKLSSEAQVLAALPKEQQQKVIKGEITRKDVKTDQRRADRIEKILSISKSNSNLTIVQAPSFPVILCDPPWRYEHAVSDSRVIENQYPTMELEDICALPIHKIALSDCVLFLWATSPKLEESLEVLKAWGFSYRTCAVWNKEIIGMGYYFRQQHELLLVATKGNLPPPKPENRLPSVFESRRTQHSEKPEVVYEAIEQMYPELPKIELFARTTRNGWKSWGNQSGS